MSTKKKAGSQSAPSSIDPFKLLKEQHREVEDLFEKLESTGDRAEKTRKKLFDELAQKVELHSELEEKVMYPFGKKEDKDTTLEAVEEHAVVKDLIKKIKRTDPTAEVFAARVTVLKELIEHHVEEEEGEYFPKLQRAASQGEIDDLGRELEKHLAKHGQGTSRKMQGLKAAAERRR